MKIYLETFSEKLPELAALNYCLAYNIPITSVGGGS